MKRATVVPVELLVLVGFVAAVGLYSCAYAAPVFKSEAHGYPVVLRLLEEPCTNEQVRGHLARQVRPEYIPKFKKSQLTYGGREWASCWIEVDGVVYSLDEEGSKLQPVMRESFQEETV